MTDTVPIEETTQREQAAMKLYAGLMEEAKARLHAVEHAINGRLGLASAQIIREFCYLQFRLLCEVIALGCLTAHGDITHASKLRKEYAADKIIKQLEELHPEFYPRPARREVT